MRVFFVASTLLTCGTLLLPRPGFAQYDAAPEGGRWLILAGHEMADTGPQATSLARYVQDPADGVWVDTVGAVAEFVTEHRRSSRVLEPQR